jgi:hypothetical protein
MPKLGELLIEAGVLSEEQIEFALRHQKQRGGRLGKHLVELGFLSESTLTKTLSKQLRLPAASAAAIERVPRDVIRLLAVDTARHHRSVPVRREGNHLWVAMSDPTDQHAIAELDSATGLTVRPMVASDLLISYGLEKHYGVQAERRPEDAHVNPALDLQIETVLPGQSSAAPLAFPQPNREERAAIEAMVQDLDERAPVVRMGLAALGQRLVGATSQRAVFDLLLSFLEQDFQRSVVLVVRNGRLAGFCAQGFGISEQVLLEYNSALGEIPVVAKVISDGRPRLGRASPATLGTLTQVIGQPGERAVLIMPLRCANEPVGCLVAIGGRDGVESYAEEYAIAGMKVDMALQMVVLRRRIME